MSVQVEKLEKNMAKLTVEVPAEEVEKALQAAYMKEKNKISIPGFRKGKVPRNMVEKMYGPEIFYEDAANLLIQKEYGAAVVCAFIYGCINVIMEFTMSTIAMMMVGSGFAAAAVAAFTSLPATVINAVFMVIAIAILYQPVKKIYVRMA